MFNDKGGGCMFVYKCTRWTTIGERLSIRATRLCIEDGNGRARVYSCMWRHKATRRNNEEDLHIHDYVR